MIDRPEGTKLEEAWGKSFGKGERHILTPEVIPTAESSVREPLDFRGGGGKKGSGPMRKRKKKSITKRKREVRTSFTFKKETASHGE